MGLLGQSYGHFFLKLCPFLLKAPYGLFNAKLAHLLKSPCALFKASDALFKLSLIHI